jgi:hypothetical protein
MAHCVSWGHQSMDVHTPQHSEEWGIHYARIYRAYMDEGGIKQSGEY